ncbi:hypothetical protein INR49_007386 [Caranx melampygus]|nr:hypothetical protein INR49_007386 [Caranx melampygus]
MSSEPQEELTAVTPSSQPGYTTVLHVLTVVHFRCLNRFSSKLGLSPKRSHNVEHPDPVVPCPQLPAAGGTVRSIRTEQGGFKAGHSLMDWIRFSKSGKDLTGLRGRLIEVTQEELQKHNTRDDCWTCIRGMVYM